MKQLVLAGGGHAHLHLLKALAARSWPNVEITLVSPYARQIYSGMVPGWMAGHYSIEQCAVPLEPLARAAGVRFIQDSVSGLDADRRMVRTATSGDLAYDALSLDTGSEIDCSCLAACGARLLPIRPLENFVVGWTRLREALGKQGRADIAVVGGGAAGVELALAARYRLARDLGTAHVRVTLVTGAALLPGHGHRVAARLARTLAHHQVDTVSGFAAGALSSLQLDDGSLLALDAVLAATGVRPADWLKRSGLALAGDGFVAVGQGQQSSSHPEVFAAGDVASRIDDPHAKSGVYAVRAGPVLTANLERWLAGLPPLAYRPQRRSLYLLATGPREAILSWGELSASGHWAWIWKDWIDRRFMSQYHLGRAHTTGEMHESA